MYLTYFGLKERPFSIAPDPHYLYMSYRHKEAMAHLSYGLSQGGCFIVLTGEVGTGKTTLCRNLLTNLPDNVDVALILNANINEQELLQTICDELKIDYDPLDSQKQLLDQINTHLLASFAENRHTVLIIDEAQLLSRDVLEKIRLLTNLETTKSKLLQIILIGQPELNDVLSRNDLRQLAQRVTARYHLSALGRDEIDDYVNFRLGVAGSKQPLFSRQALSKLHRLSGGIPRRINVLADHALLAAYSKTSSMVDSKSVKQAAKEVFVQAGKTNDETSNRTFQWWALAATVITLNLGLWWFFHSGSTSMSGAPPIVSTPASVTTISNATIGQRATTPTGQTGGVSSTSAGVATVGPVSSPTSDPLNSSANDSMLAAVAPSAGARSGSVVIADDYLDEESAPVASAQVAVARLPATPAYDSGSEFGRVLDTSADLTGNVTAIRNLSQAWDVELPQQLIRDACDELRAQAVTCLTASTWGQVLRFNRPAILVLEQGDQLHRVILFKIDGEQAQVLVGEDVYTVSTAELQARWARSALTLWRPGETGNRLLQRGDNSRSMPRVRKQLNDALIAANLPTLEDLDSTEMTLDMAQKTFAIQSQFGLKADSKIGNETYLLLNELVAPDDTPVLRQRRP